MTTTHRIMLIEDATYTAVQTSATIKNDYYDSIEILFDIDAIVSASLTMKLQAVTADGSVVTVFTFPAEAATGVKRYVLYPGATGSTTDKNSVLPARFNIVVTPATNGNADNYKAEVTLYNVKG